MSLVDPAARAQRARTSLRPFAWVLALLGLASGPILSAIGLASNEPYALFGPFAAIYLVATVGFGILLYYVAAHRNGVGIVAFCFAYAGGLILISGLMSQDTIDIPTTIVIALVLYAVGLVLLVIYFVNASSANLSLRDGVSTTATVTRAGITGMVNYVQHWRLTCKFTDQQGKERWFHLGRTGLGYSVGDTFQIKYNPKNPGSRRGIVVLDN